MKLKTFFDDEFRQFSIADCIRSIPSIVDGFKPSQRKCIFGMIKRGENSGEIKVASLSGHVSLCMAPDTKVLLVDNRTIRVLELTRMFDSGDITEIGVLSYNEITKQTEVDICTAAWCTKEVMEIIDIELSDGNVVSLTDNHMVYTTRGQLRTDELNIDDTMVSRSSNTISVKKLTTRYLTEPMKVYDITVKNNHNFFAGDSNILLHNCSAYHHGEASLNETIVGLAQDYTGSNNVNYFSPNGQFGSRLSDEASAPRYIFTEFTKEFRKIFKKDDDIILNFLEEDGSSIEPDFYLPILPNVLINGARGMGTGYATNILKYNPNDLKNNILALLQGKQPDDLLPWYRGYKGTITNEGMQIINTGCYEITNSTTIKITELPIGVYLDGYKAHLIKMKDMGLIKDFDDYSTDQSFEFVITAPRTTIQLPPDEILKKFKLVGKNTQNFTLWTEEGHIKVFANAQAIIDHFVTFRLDKYEERRLKLLEILNTDLFWYNEKKRFILYYLENSKLFASKSKKEIDALLTELSFVNISDLLDIKIYNLTKDEIDKLEKQIEKTIKEIAALEKTNCVKMYVKELTELDL